MGKARVGSFLAQIVDRSLEDGVGDLFAVRFGNEQRLVFGAGKEPAFRDARGIRVGIQNIIIPYEILLTAMMKMFLFSVRILSFQEYLNIASIPLENIVEIQDMMSGCASI